MILNDKQSYNKEKDMFKRKKKTLVQNICTKFIEKNVVFKYSRYTTIHKFGVNKIFYFIFLKERKCFLSSNSAYPNDFKN